MDFEKGVARNLTKLRNIKVGKNIILLKISPIFRPKLGEEQKKSLQPKLSPIFRPKLGEEQKQKRVQS